MNIKSVTTAELSHHEVTRVASEVVTGLANSPWTAELVDTLVARVASAVVERVGKTAVDVSDVGCYRVAAAVNERLLKTLTTTAAGDVRIIQTAHDELYRAQQRITELQKQLAQKHDDCVDGEAATAMKLERERLVEQIDRLARCLRDVTGEFRPTEGTCAAAIRVIGEQNARITELREQLVSARARFDAYRAVVSLRSKDKP